MDKISRRKLIGLIENEWYGIEMCKIDSIITFIENLPNELLDQPQKLKPVPFKRTAHDFCNGYCETTGRGCEFLNQYNHEYQYTDYKCPSCNKRVSDGNPNNCCHCGQALDWSKE